MTPTFFPTPATFRRWLKMHHQTAPELAVGFYKLASGRPSITWPQAVDEALCVGWIDGIRRNIDAESYQIRFTPRRPRSNWSQVNIDRMAVLIAEKRVLPAGLQAFALRSEARSAIYSYEQKKIAILEPALEHRFRSAAAAWDFFQAQPPSYRQTSTWWIMSAKQSATREKRLAKLIDVSAAGRRLT